jgi:hypothetical protein
LTNKINSGHVEQGHKAVADPKSSVGVIANTYTTTARLSPCQKHHAAVVPFNGPPRAPSADRIVSRRAIIPAHTRDDLTPTRLLLLHLVSYLHIQYYPQYYP